MLFVVNEILGFWNLLDEFSKIGQDTPEGVNESGGPSTRWYWAAIGMEEEDGQNDNRTEGPHNPGCISGPWGKKGQFSEWRWLSVTRVENKLDQHIITKIISSWK